MKKISLCMIVKPSDDEAELLDRCLSYVAPHVDEICINITGLNAKCEQACKKYKAKYIISKWVNNFAYSRNKNFAQATGEYIIWLDCDDVLKGAENLRAIVEKMEEMQVGAVAMNYLYDFDDQKRCTVKHLKTRILKRGVAEWVGELHEDFSPIIEHKSFFAAEVEVYHLTNEVRSAESTKRNIEIAKSMYEKSPEDPRSFWLMANALLGEGKGKEAEEWYEKFLETSNSEEEKFIGWLRIGDIRKSESDYLQALALRPSYPDAYIKLGELYYNERKFVRAKDFLLEGLKKNIPERSIVVYNPREYDFHPMMILAQVYYELGEYKNVLEVMKRCALIYPKHPRIIAIQDMIKVSQKMEKDVDEFIRKAEKIKDKKKLKKMCDKFKYQSHPKFSMFKNLNFIKETSSGKDLVYYCSHTHKVWNPEIAAKEGVGGSEEAVINLSKGFAEKGWNVTVYCNCGQEGTFDGVQYKPYWDFNIRDKQDVMILWRYPQVVDFEVNCDRIFLDLHDVISEKELTPARLAKIEKIFVKTKSHQDLFPNTDQNKFVIIPNGIDVSMFEKGTIKKDPYFILTTSSADRHLDATLDIFEALIKKQPDKPWRLGWYYGWANYLDWHKDNKEMMDFYYSCKARFDKLVEQGRAEGGVMISHQEIADKYLEAGIFMYPTSFYEIHCISALKAQAAGCRMITSDAFALDETVQFGTKIHTEHEKWGTSNTFGETDKVEEYVNAILMPNEDTTELQVKWAKKIGSWEGIINKWNTQLNG